jgi:autotransporter-associated beta strand protein
LTWTRASTSSARDTVIFRSTSATAPTLAQGTAYAVNDTVGGATCIYNGSDASASSSGLAGGTQYYYHFFAINNNYYSAAATANATTQAGAPAAPTLSSGSVTATSFNVSWDAVPNATSYKIDVSTNSGFSSFVTGYNDATVTSPATISGLSPNTLYYVRARSVGSGGTSASSTPSLQVTTLLDHSYTTTQTVSTALTGSGNLTMNGASQTLTLSAVNTYTGSTTISGGTLALSGSGSIADSSRVNVGTPDVFDISGVTTSATVKILSEIGSSDGGSAKLGSKTLIMNGGDAAATYYFNFLGVSGDTGGFTMNSPNANTTLNLYGVSQYTGTTTVSGGTLITGNVTSTLDIIVSGGIFTSGGDNFLSNSANLTVNSGTANLNGSDTIANFSGSGGSVSIASGKTITATITGSQSYSGNMSGSGSFIKAGAGTLTLAGASANTYAGTTTVSSGILILDKSDNVNALAGTPTINTGATLRLASSNQFNGDTTFLTIYGTFDMAGYNDTLAFQGNGTITLGAGTLSMNPGATDTFSGGISGSGGLTKINAGTQILSGSNSYTGLTAINAGILEIQHDSALGATGATQNTTISNGAQLKIYHASGLNSAEPLNIAGVGDNSGAIRNVGGANTLSGGITLNGNSRINSDAGTTTTVSGTVGGGSNVLFIGGAGNTGISNAISGAGNTQDGTTSSLFKDGNGTLTLSGDNSYTGDTRVTAGNLTVSSGGDLGTGSDVFISNGAQLNVNANSAVASVQETGNSNGGIMTIGSGAVLTVNGANKGTFYQNSISGAGGLTMSGSGNTTLVVYGTQSYTGTTTVTGGAFSTGVAMSTTNVVITGGTLFLSSGGTIDSADVTLGSGGTLDITGPLTGRSLGASKVLTASATGSNTTGTVVTGDSTAKSFSLGTGSLTFSNYGGGATAPLTVSGSGEFQLNSRAITVNTSSALAAGTYTLIAKSGSANVTGTPGSLTVGGSGLAAGGSATLSVSSGQLVMTVVTPPTLTTPTATSISTTSATLGATVTSNGGGALSARGTVWGTSASPTTNQSAEGGTSVAAFSHSRSGLTANTLYYYRGYATNTAGTAYSADGTFTTLPNAPTVGSASSITATGFTASWTAPSPAGSATYTYSLETSTDNSSFSSATTGIASSSTSQAVTGLSSGTTYYFRVRAVNAGGTSA